MLSGHGRASCGSHDPVAGEPVTGSLGPVPTGSPNPVPTGSPTAAPIGVPTPPSCVPNELDGDVLIEGSSDPEVLDTSDSPCLTNVTGWVKIHSNAGLASLDGGFRALRGIGGELSINQNGALTSLDGGFSALQRVGTFLSIGYNNALTSLGNGLSSLRQIRGGALHRKQRRADLTRDCVPIP